LAVHRPRLQTLIFEVTQRCNHTCLHCYNVWNHRGFPYPRGELNTSQTLALLSKALDESGCRHVTLTGGEPLLREDLQLILDLLYRRHVQTTLISNGRLLSKETIRDLLERGVGLFELPLLSHRREMHDYLSGSVGAFDAVLEAMAHLREHRGNFVMVFVLTRLNLLDLYETIRLAFAFGARGIMLNRFNPGGRGLEHLAELMPSSSQVREALAVVENASAELGIPTSCSIPIQPCLVEGVWEAYRSPDGSSPFSHLRFGFCAAGTDRAYYTLDPLGNLRPCNHTPLILGSLLEEPFEKLIAPGRISSFTSAFPPFCDSCSLRDICQGGCKAAAQVCYGSLSSEDPFLHDNRG